METIEIPRSELMNYLPYSLIEEALGITPSDLLRSSSRKQPREESRIGSYLNKKASNFNSSHNLQSLMQFCNFEQEVGKEIKKILHKKTLSTALKNNFILEQTENQIKTLLDNEDKENINPGKSKLLYSN
jgi:hypothetical protein